MFLRNLRLSEEEFSKVMELATTTAKYFEEKDIAPQILAGALIACLGAMLKIEDNEDGLEAGGKPN